MTAPFDIAEAREHLRLLRVSMGQHPLESAKHLSGALDALEHERGATAHARAERDQAWADRDKAERERDGARADVQKMQAHMVNQARLYSGLDKPEWVARAESAERRVKELEGLLHRFTDHEILRLDWGSDFPLQRHAKGGPTMGDLGAARSALSGKGGGA